MPALEATIAANLERVRGRIAAAAAQVGRAAADIRLIAVTKYVSTEVARAVVAAGCCDLGESRPQDLWVKAAALADLPICWHFIGHLQRNKIDRTLPHLTLLHSGDSLRLLQAVHAALPESAHLPTLLEVNISGEARKHGFAPHELPAVLAELPALPKLSVRGLMGMSGLESSPAEKAAEFASLRQLRDELQASGAGPIALPELSMGMSDDFELAIAAGATMVRVGSALFEGLP